MKQQKEEWIENILNQADKIKRAEANVFLFEKIMNRMQAEQHSEIFKWKNVLWKFTIGFAVLLLLNIFSIRKLNSSHSGKNHSTGSDYEYFINYNYNY
jgi:hypothetical protein